MAAKKPRAPTGLGARGNRFWRATLAEFELSKAELELLAEACRTLDEIDALNAVIEADGATVAGSKGQIVVHPAYAAIRASRSSLGRLVAQLQLPDPDGATIPSASTLRARKAAATRWRRDRRREEQRRGPAA